MRFQQFIALSATLLLLSSHLRAQTIPGRWDMVDALNHGTPIVVILKAGDRIECSFKSSSLRDITFIDEQGIERKVPKAEVEVIETAEKIRDGLANGTLIGAVIGAGTGFAYEASYWDWDESGAIAIPFVAAIIGAAVGAGVDGLLKKPKVLYRVPPKP
jgi:hypothetical protein